MKKLLLLSGLMIVALGAYAQGNVNFANGAAGVSAPITNGTVSPSVLATGPGFQAQLYVGPAGTLNSTLLTTNGVGGTPQPFAASPQGFFFGSTRIITGSPEGTILTMQVRAWATSAGSSWEAAGPAGRGESNLIQVSLGGIGPTPNMVGLQSFTIGGVPEPSSIALGLLGLGAIALFRRRK
jgi:hypothetical protein